jgi:threonine/homoserine/homoserine lactone efflux protein
MLAAFLVASLILAVTPGPGVFYIVTRSLMEGRASGLASVAGVALGNLGNSLAASLGLAALLAVSAAVFSVLKLAGAAYLIYLGIQSLRAARTSALVPTALPHSRPLAIFRDGFFVALLNPKTALFFAAFLPQFVHPGSSAIAQTVLLGALFVLIAAVTDTFYALAAGAVYLRGGIPRLDLRVGQTSRRRSRYLAGGAFLGLGLYAAFSGSRTPHR